jgi:hypothetical protein
LWTRGVGGGSILSVEVVMMGALTVIQEAGALGLVALDWFSLAAPAWSVCLRMLSGAFPFLVGVRGHPSIPLLPLFLTMSICIPHGLYTYPTTPVPLRPPSDNRRSSSISQYSTILPTSLQPRLMPRNYHRPHRDRVT